MEREVLHNLRSKCASSKIRNHTSQLYKTEGKIAVSILSYNNSVISLFCYYFSLTFNFMPQTDIYISSHTAIQELVDLTTLKFRLFFLGKSKRVWNLCMLGNKNDDVIRCKTVFLRS
jgi:hypothetical protein